jgi:hypothetical protein
MSATVIARMESLLFAWFRNQSIQSPKIFLPVH